MTRKTVCPECRKKLGIKGDPSRIRCPGCQTVFSPEYEAEPEPELALETEIGNVPEAPEDDLFVEETGDQQSSSTILKSIPVIPIAAAAVVLIVLAIAGVVVAGKISYKSNIKYVNMQLSEISPDTAQEGVEACQYIINNADTASPDFQEAVFKYGVYLHQAGDNASALAHFKSKCLDYNIRPEMSAVYVTQIHQDSGNTDEAVALARRIIEMDAQLPSKYKEKAAEVYIASLSKEPDPLKIKELLKTVNVYREQFPLNETIGKVELKLLGIKKEQDRKAEEIKLKEVADRFREDVLPVVTGIHNGVNLYEKNSYPEAFHVLRNVIPKLKTIPFDLDGVATQEKVQFQKSYDRFLKGSKGFGSTDYAQVSALGRKALDAYDKLPGRLRNSGYVFRAGEWEKLTREEATKAAEADDTAPEALDMHSLVRKLINDEVAKLAEKPQSRKTTVIVTKQPVKEYSGDIVKEDDLTVVIRTLFGPVTVVKTSIQKRESKTGPTRYANMKDMLLKIHDNRDLLNGLKNASNFAVRNKLPETAKVADHCYMYLNPRDLKIISKLGYLNQVYGACDACKGTGYGSGGKKGRCGACDGTGRKVCERCNGVGWVKCTECIQKGIHAGKVRSSRPSPTGEITEYKKCKECKGTTKDKCPVCKGRKYMKLDKCEKCKGEGFFWRSKPAICAKCRGEKKLLNPEFIKDPYSFLLREK